MVQSVLNDGMSECVRFGVVAEKKQVVEREEVAEKKYDITTADAEADARDIPLWEAGWNRCKLSTELEA